MSKNLSTLPLDALQTRVVEAIRERWVPVQAPAKNFTVPPEKVDEVAERALTVMLHRPFRVSKLPPEEERQQLLKRVRYWVARGKPIRITLGYAPMKNLRAVEQSRADWSEFFALTHLAVWHNKVCGVYSPGLRIKIVFDDSTVAMANQPDRKHMTGYMKSIDRLIDAMQYRALIVGTMKQSSFAWLFNLGLYQWAGRRVRKWEAQPENAETVEQMLAFARRNVLAPAGLDEAEHEAFFQAASHRYRVYVEALHMSGLSRLGHALLAMYLDGSQHHRRHRAALHLATLGKEQVTQPWQGEGALRDNGRGRLVPLALTAGRRERMDCREVRGLDLIDLPGFDRIVVCANSRRP